MVKKIVVRNILVLLMLSSFAMAAEVTGKFSGSMGTLMNSGQDNAWHVLKARVGLYIKKDNTKIYWETKADSNKFSYLYADMPLTIVPGGVRVGYHRYGVKDAEYGPYADGVLYSETKQKGWGLSYYNNIYGLDIKLTHLGNAFFLDNKNDEDDTDSQTKSCLGFMVRDGKKWGLGAIVNSDGDTGNGGVSAYGDLSLKLYALNLTGVYFKDFSKDANKSTITGESKEKKARDIAGLYVKYNLNKVLTAYVNGVLDIAEADFKNLVSGGIKAKLANNLSGYIHAEQKADLDVNTNKVYLALEVKIK